jgi:hypothetical protein
MRWPTKIEVFSNHPNNSEKAWLKESFTLACWLALGLL